MVTRSVLRPAFLHLFYIFCIDGDTNKADDGFNLWKNIYWELMVMEHSLHKEKMEAAVSELARCNVQPLRPRITVMIVLLLINAA